MAPDLLDCLKPESLENPNDVVAAEGPDDGERQTLHVPLHHELKPGTLRAIFRQASDYVPADELRTHFFAD